MIYALIIYIIFGGLWSKKSYLKSQCFPFWVKATHLILTLILFMFYFNHFRIMLWDIIRDGIISISTSKVGVYAFGQTTDLIISISFFLTSFFVTGLALSLASRLKSRKLLLITSPFIIASTSFYIYKFSIVNSITKKDNLFLLILIVLITLFFTIINLFYNIKPGKKLFKIEESTE